MKLNLKDEPKQWRKSAWLAILGLALICSLLRWHGRLPENAWLATLVILAALAVVIAFKPQWFRGYHLFSMRLGFAISQFLGRVLLILFFIVILTPVAWMLRLVGKDFLQLKRPRDATTYWRSAKEYGPLERPF